MGKPSREPLTLETAKKAKPGTVAVNPKTGVVAQKHGPNSWYLAQDWEGDVGDAGVVGDVVITVTKFKVRTYD